LLQRSIVTFVCHAVNLKQMLCALRYHRRTPSNNGQRFAVDL